MDSLKILHRAACLSFVFFLPSVALAKSEPRKPLKAPAAIEALQSLMRHAGEPLPFGEADSNTDCQTAGGARPGSEKATIGDYLAILIANAGIAEKGAKKSLKLTCREYDAKLDFRMTIAAPKDAWICDFNGHSLDKPSGDTWNYSFRFALKKDTLRIVPGAFDCPGTP